jgi:hypothetical protein
MGRDEGQTAACEATHGTVRMRRGVRQAGEAQLRRSPDKSIIQATDFADRHDLARFRRLDRPPSGVFLVREVGPGVMVVREVCVQRRRTCSVGGSPTGATARRPVAWMAGRRETNARKPSDETIGRMGASGRAVTGGNARIASTNDSGGRALTVCAKAAGIVAVWLTRRVPSGGV